MHDPYAWPLDFEALLFVPALAVGYLFVVRRYGASRLQVTCFTVGLALILAVFVTPLHPIALHFLLSIHLLQNVVLAEWAPALCVVGLPAALPVPRRLTHPFVALPLWAGTYFAWHVPAIYDGALRHQESLLHLEHVSYFVTGLLFWWPVLKDEPHRVHAGARAIYLFAAFVIMSPLGLLLALIPRPVYDFYVQAPHRLWGLSPLTDQQIGGASMALEQSLLLFAVGTWYFLRFLSGEGRADAYRTLDPSSYNQNREMRDGR
ncbi:MAG TPA: cytochrome c oxidase assembly protein [Gaiellaceae bacterium]|jgi:cytochrome c oxidase assembly factor CtaG